MSEEEVKNVGELGEGGGGYRTYPAGPFSDLTGKLNVIQRSTDFLPPDHSDKKEEKKKNCWNKNCWTSETMSRHLGDGRVGASAKCFP